MKKIFILICILLNNYSAIAQIACPLQPGISLLPSNTNTHWNWKGDDPNKFDGTGNFYFRQEFQTVIGLSSNFSPFASNNNQPNTGHFTIFPIDYEPSDGWELAYRYFGEIIPCQTNSTSTPYFVLYNRFTGILRIFVTLTSNPIGNGVAISLEKSGTNKKSASLAYAEELISPLQIFSTDPGEMKFTNEAISNGSLTNGKSWYYADFKIYYDPCVCNNQVDWVIKFDFITTSSITMTSDGIEEELLGQGVAGSNKASAFTVVKGVGTAVGGAVKAGVKAYKEGKSYQKESEDFIENHREFLVDDTEWMSNSSLNRVKSVLGIIPGATAAIAAVDFLSTAFGFLKKDQGTVVRPYRSKIETTYEGYIVSSNHPLNQTLRVPGSHVQSRKVCVNGVLTVEDEDDIDGQKVPVYNRPLGVVSLITPVIMEYVEYRSDPVIRKITTWPFGGYSDERVTPNPVREYRVANDLKFAVNPASDLEIESVDFAFFFEFPNMPTDNCTEVGDRYPLSDYGPFSLGYRRPLGRYYLADDPDHEDTEIEDNCGNSGTLLKDLNERFNKAGFEIFTAVNRVTCSPGIFQSPLGERVNLSDVTFKTPTLPIQLIKSQTMKIFHDGGNPFSKVKFTIFMKHRLTGERFLEVVSYRVRSEDFVHSSLDPQNLSYSCNRHVNACKKESAPFPQDVTVYQHYPVSISTSPFSNCLSGLPVRIDFSDQQISDNQSAIYQVNIGPNTSFQGSSADPIEIKALEINVAPNVEFPPFVTLVPGLLDCFSGTSILASLQDVNNVCGSQSYISRSSSREAVASVEGKNLLFATNTTELGFPIPNPTNSICQLSFDLAEPSGYEMHISNAMGVNVMQLEARDFASSGKHTINFSTERLEAGVYNISFSSDGFRQARKLVVVK